MKSFRLGILTVIITLGAGCATNSVRIPPPEDLSGAHSYDENKQRLANAQQILDQILAVQEPRTIANTLKPYNELSLELDGAYGNAGLFGATHPNKEIRDKALKQEQEIDKFSTALSLNRDLYEAIKAVDVSQADRPTQFFYKKTMRGFRRSGVDKDEKTRTKIAKLQEELSKIGQDFNKNIREDVRYVYAKPSQLKGLPKDYINSHKPETKGKHKGLIKISTNYPDLFPVLRYAEDYKLRRKLYLAFTNRAYPKNRRVLRKLIEKRYELAKLLGYDSWAQYATEDKMMKSDKAAEKFINEIAALAKARSDQDYKELLAEKQKVFSKATQVHAWGRHYWITKLKETKYKLDSQEVRKYFEFNKVKNGIFRLTEKLFDVHYERVTDVKLWHEDVEAWDIYDGSERLGRFYLDLHPRDNKYKHAAQFPFRTGITGTQLPQATLVTNFPNPRTTDGPALMEHSQVETFLHEFGHLLHTMFSGKHEWEALSGIKTEWDFVEVPSQMLEEWIWDTETLQSFAKHYETGKPIPTALIDKMKAAKEFGVGLQVRQQMFYAALSLSLYNRSPNKVNIDRFERDLHNKYSPYRHMTGAHFTYNFGHLNGYSAIYYTYMWSMVIAKDLFSEFEKNGLFDSNTANRYREKILSRGGSNYADELVTDFLGRKFSYDAFKKWLN